MKVFIKHSKTGLWMTPLGEWTTKTREALSFRSMEEAKDFCQNHIYYDTCLVVHLANHRHDMELQNA